MDKLGADFALAQEIYNQNVTDEDHDTISTQQRLFTKYMMYLAVQAAKAEERAKCAKEVDALKWKFKFNSEEAIAVQSIGIAVALGNSDHIHEEG